VRDIEGIAQLEPTICGDRKDFDLILEGDEQIVSAGSIEVSGKVDQHGLGAGGDIKGAVGTEE
jgi:hypothetical protein